VKKEINENRNLNLTSQNLYCPIQNCTPHPKLTT
jgi:hypothetical protein